MRKICIVGLEQLGVSVRTWKGSPEVIHVELVSEERLPYMCWSACFGVNQYSQMERGRVLLRLGGF